ncbi:MAG: type II toxin-antitoxin system Y4mF family antitoxin [Flavihumibacter sp.]
MDAENNTLSRFIKEKRKQARLSQPALAAKAGVGLRFVRDLEQGKATLKMDKVNQVLKLFGHELGLVPLNRKSLTDEEG